MRPLSENMKADRCAGCGKELTVRDDGAREACCSRAYWSKQIPLGRDQWYPTPEREGWYLYGWEWAHIGVGPPFKNLTYIPHSP